MDITNYPSIYEIRKTRLRQLETEAGGRKFLAEKMDVAYTQITNVLSEKAPRNIGNSMARKAEEAMGKPSGWLDRVEGVTFAVLDANQGASAKQVDYTIGVADDFSDNWKEIPYYYATGACGNGSENPHEEQKGTLRKELSWFTKYNVKPVNLFTVYAEGDSNADFIMEGDMVIFDRSKTAPKDNTMFFIKHPAGDRIKTLRQKANGNWLLCSRNHDKTRFPDEEITTEEAQQIEILGEYVYRQG